MKIFLQLFYIINILKILNFFQSICKKEIMVKLLEETSFDKLNSRFDILCNLQEDVYNQLITNFNYNI